ncbi:uncharacterized protein LOC131177011 [Hevea brasiliensis]|uniref:uncharacterized protein LOC131177011 n=1 Tax=Hevea brasiliensis TaxID=3981 RepID=UPI0025D634FF|nr:uncharacterized protein LOC131177011 [Hevea brasiliensis]
MTMRQERITGGAFSMQKQHFGKGKQLPNPKNKSKHDGGNSSEGSKKSFPHCKRCKKRTHLEKYYWWRPDTVCGNCKQMGHISKVCKSKNKTSKSSQAQLADAVEAQEEQLFAVSCFSMNDPSDAWLINNGCTHHLCNNAEIFRILDDTYNSRVKVGNGEFLEVKGRWSMAVSIILGIKTISDILYIPGISQNLLIVEQMLEKNYSLFFKDRICTIFYPSGIELFYVKMNNKSFVVNFEKATEQAYISASQSVTNLWHRRLGHVNQRSIAEMNKKGLVENMPEISCDAQVCEILPEPKRSKLDNKAQKGIFMCYGSSSKGYKIFCLRTEKIIMSKDVKFDEATAWDWEKQKDAHTPLYPKVQPQLAADELVDYLLVKGTRTLEDIYQRCSLVVNEPTSYAEAQDSQA